MKLENMHYSKQENFELWWHENSIGYHEIVVYKNGRKIGKANLYDVKHMIDGDSKERNIWDVMGKDAAMTFARNFAKKITP